MDTDEGNIQGGAAMALPRGAKHAVGGQRGAAPLGCHRGPKRGLPRLLQLGDRHVPGNVPGVGVWLVGALKRERCWIETVLDWPKRCKLAHAFRWEYIYKGQKVAQLLG